MEFPITPAPHWRQPTSVRWVMGQVLLALIPGVTAAVWFLGIGVLLNILCATVTVLACEALMLQLRQRPAGAGLGDLSAIVSAILLALCLPPLTPWWVTAVAGAFAMIFAKHLYGGLGYNIFNPAMAGYAVIMVSFPGYMAFWPATTGTDMTIAWFLTGSMPAGIDAISGATPLDFIKTQLGAMRTMGEIQTMPAWGFAGHAGWVTINLMMLAGGAYLLLRKIIRWHIPVALLTALLVCASIASIQDPATNPGILLHLLSGGTMLCAFFVATDPVSAAASPRGRLIYGAGIGVLIYIIRTWGAYPDGIAFAVLLLNLAVPLIDRYTVPPVYGHARQ